MSWHQRNVTLSGATRIISTHTPVKQVIIFNTAGNAAVSVGDSNLTAANFGFSIAAGAVGPTIGPFSGEAPLNLDEIFLIGTDTQIVHVAYVT